MTRFSLQLAQNAVRDPEVDYHLDALRPLIRTEYHFTLSGDYRSYPQPDPNERIRPTEEDQQSGVESVSLQLHRFDLQDRFEEFPERLNGMMLFPDMPDLSAPHGRFAEIHQVGIPKEHFHLLYFVT